MVAVAPIITGISFILYIPHTLYFYCTVFVFLNFLVFLITFQSPEISISINRRGLFSLSRIHYHHQLHHYPLSLLHSSLAGSQNSTRLTDEALPFHSSTESFPTIQHVVSIAAFCFRICRLGRRLSSLKLSCNLCVIIHTVDSRPTNDIR